MGESKSNLFEPDFNRSIKVQSTDHQLGLLSSVAQNVDDPRRDDRIRYTITELLRERVYAMAIGYQAQDDLDRLAHDPAFRAAVWDRPGQNVINERLGNGFIHATLRQGQVHTANGVKRFIDNVQKQASNLAVNVDYRMDAGYTIGAEELLAHYRPRGTFEDRLGEFNAAIGPHLSSQPFKANEATMLLGLLSFNLSSICRNELEDAVGGCWDLTRFQLFILKVGGEIIKHSRRAILRIAESAQPLWSLLIERLESWATPTDQASNTPSTRAWMPPPAHSHLSEVLRT